jgi:hypothetical protein
MVGEMFARASASPFDLAWEREANQRCVRVSLSV